MTKLKSLRLFIFIIATGVVALYSMSLLSSDWHPLLKRIVKSPYDSLWKKVDSLEALGLTESSQVIVKDIFNISSKEQNNPQRLKSLLHLLKYNETLEEDALRINFEFINKEIAKSEFPYTQVLHSIRAQILLGYFQTNRWRFYNRTQTVNFQQDDIETWDLTKIINETFYSYNQSLRNETGLQSILVDIYEPILAGDDSLRNRRPTLYDFLAHRALEFFKNNESGLTQPAYAFDLNDARYFSETRSFVNLKITTQDTLNHFYHALKTYQALLSFHQMHDNKDALTYLELDRMNFLQANTVLPEKDSLFLKRLEALQQTNVSSDVSAEVLYQIALFYSQRAIQYKPFDESKSAYKNDYLTALSYCDKAIERYPHTLGGNNAKYLAAQIHTTSLSLQIENGNPSAEYIPTHISYANINQAYFRLYRVNYDEYYKWITDNESRRADSIYYFIKENPLAEQWSVNLTGSEDHQPHSTEIAINPQGYGFYILVASNSSDFSMQNNNMTYTTFWVTDLMHVSRPENNYSENTLLLFNRKTGEPVSQADVILYKSDYNYTTRKYERKKIRSLKTGKDGNLLIPYSGKNGYTSFSFEFRKGKDRYVSVNSIYQYEDWYGFYDEDNITVYFFLDRGIYRPGQTVYFKGIVINTNNDVSKIVTKYKTTVSLFDVNYEEVAHLDLISNDFGTFSGSFVIPQGRITGQWHLGNDDGETYFSVEEYKRPKFEVNFDTVKTEYKLGDQITISGTGEALAGYPIDGANVSYRIYRDVHFPDWVYWWHRGFAWNKSQMEITHGSTQTDDNGKFKLKFEAIPDKSVNPKWEPVFNYIIEVSVTDLNGETCTGYKYIQAGYSSLQIYANIPDKLSKNDTAKYKLEVLNHENFPQPNEGKVTITRLTSPLKLIKDKGWDRVDQPIMDEKTFHSYFPHLPYADEMNPTQWKHERILLESNFNLSNNTLQPNEVTNLDPGIYLIEASTTDKYGKTATYKKIITVYDEKKNTAFTPDYFTLISRKNLYKPGETAEFLLSTEAKNMLVLMEIEVKEKIVYTEILRVSQAQKLIQIPIKEEHRGNFSIHFTTVKDNRLYNQIEVISVPYSNKELTLKFSTFRNELLPGSQEEWKITVSDFKEEKAAAEMLVSMYDASLDAFVSNNWWFNPNRWYHTTKQWSSNDNMHMTQSTALSYNWNNPFRIKMPTYEYLNTFGYEMVNYYLGNGYFSLEPMSAYDEESDLLVSGTSTKREDGDKLNENKGTGEKQSNMLALEKRNENSLDYRSTNATEQKNQVRTNFDETAFFYPHLQTNEQGEVVFAFKMPESITAWNFNALAHTKDLKVGMLSEKVITRKKLMINSFAPRFFREGDILRFSTKVTNISGEDLNVDTRLTLTDALTGENINSKCKLVQTDLSQIIKKGKSEQLSWEIQIPIGISAITYRVTATGGEHSDGEEMTIPVLSNRMLVTESQPIYIKGKGEKTFSFEKLIKSNSSSTLSNHKLTLELTSNPVWYAIQALPYMMEYPYECSEQTFNRLYANILAHYIVNSNSRIKHVFDVWNKYQPNALLSNLEKSQELKEVILQETPWVMDAKNESERKQRISLLFDLNRMTNEKQRTIHKLVRMQTPNGGWPWFDGGPDDRFITQYIITGLGKLYKTGVKDEQRQLVDATEKGIQYLDNRILEDYQNLLRLKVDLTKKQIGHHQIQYLYARSFFDKVDISERNSVAWKFYMEQAKTYWNTENMFMKAMIALALHRSGDKNTPRLILRSLKENAIRNEELGMYWKQNQALYWYESPIETQAIMIEAFAEIENDITIVDELKLWLLKNKQTNDWKTTKATADACYALLLKGSDWLSETEMAVVKLGDEIVKPNQSSIQTEAGTGYIKTSWDAKDIKPSMGNISIKKSSDGPTWGAVYWQYFENLDKISSAATQIKINKKLFKQEHTDRGPALIPITNKTPLVTGDRVIVRIELSTDRNLEYLHMKDMRASAFEPENVFSGYKWQDGFGYYEATKDVATHIFIDFLPKGTFVFEYPVRVTHEGVFSNGITTLQCMYAPEFSSHSEGIIVKTGK